MKFTEENILKVFGNEAAESEDSAALRNYYFKSKVYEQATSAVPLRIIVGHKGIGKSALFKVAAMEDQDTDVLSVMIKPDDVLGIASHDHDFLQLIRDWKTGLRNIILQKILEHFPASDPGARNVINAAGTIFSVAISSLKIIHDKIELSEPKKKLLAKFLENQQANVYIDDLDRGWEAKRGDIRRISALLNAVRDMSAETPKLRFKISLRSDVYFLVRTSDESTDKIEGSVIWHAWTNHEILALLVKRIDNYWGRTSIDEQLLSTSQHDLSLTLNSIMEKSFFGRGKWREIPMYRMLMSLIRRRPRDLIKLCTLAAKQAYIHGDTHLHTKHFDAIFETYSQERLQDTINEFRSELPAIEALLLNMKPSKKEKLCGMSYKFTTSQLFEKISSIMSRTNFLLANGQAPDRKDLAHFMYKINFLTARKDLGDEKIDRKYFEENRYVTSRFADFGYGWEIHPAYRWALQPDDLQSIIDTLD